MKRRWRIRLARAVVGLTLVGSPLLAQEPSEERANELAVFLGGTSEDDETHFTLGVEYERRLGERLGLAVVVEHVSEVDAWVFLAPFTFRPAPRLGLKLYAGPGFESKQPEIEHPPGAEEAPASEGGRETFFVFRLGAGWVFELGRVSLTPQLEFDFTREQDEWRTAIVFGVAVGFGF
jgi:hypothetical protein